MSTHIANAVTTVLPKRGSPRHHGVGFWVVALTFLTLAAFTTVPSPLYGLYQARDGFSEFMLTVIYAAYAIGVIGALALAGHLSDWYGRRRLLIPAAAFTIASAIVFLTWKSVPGLLLARVLSGISIGLTQSTATAYLAELHAGHRPEASGTRAQVTATTVNMGGLGVGALVAGLLAQWVGDPLTVPYVVFLIAAAVALVAVALSPETREAVKPRPRYRPQRVVGAGRGPRRVLRRRAQRVHRLRGDGAVRRPVRPVPGRRAAPSLARARRSHAVRRLLRRSHRAARDHDVVRCAALLAAGMALMLLGLAATVTAVWLPAPSLALFIIGGAVTGAGGGAIFKGAVATVIRISPPESRAEALAGTYLAAFVGLSVPIVGAGVALAEGVSPRVTLLGFAIAVAIGIVASAIKLLPGARGPVPRAAVAKAG